MDIRASLLQMVGWYSHQVGYEMPDGLLAPDFLFDDGFSEICGSEFARATGGALLDLVILDILVADSQAAILFEGICEITNLHRRYCWMVMMKADKVQRIIACNESVVGPRERPAWIPY